MKPKTFEEARQFAFTKTVGGLYSQAWNQCGGHRRCKYVNGPMRCAVGWLLNDPQSQDGMSGSSHVAMYDLGLVPELAEWLEQASTQEKLKFEQFLSRMVMAHDSYPNSDAMYEQFAELGKELNLEWPLEES